MMRAAGVKSAIRDRRVRRAQKARRAARAEAMTYLMIIKIPRVSIVYRPTTAGNYGVTSEPNVSRVFDMPIF